MPSATTVKVAASPPARTTDRGCVVIDGAAGTAMLPGTPWVVVPIGVAAGSPGVPVPVPVPLRVLDAEPEPVEVVLPAVDGEVMETEIVAFDGGPPPPPPRAVRRATQAAAGRRGWRRSDETSKDDKTDQRMHDGSGSWVTIDPCARKACVRDAYVRRRDPRGRRRIGEPGGAIGDRRQP